MFLPNGAFVDLQTYDEGYDWAYENYLDEEEQCYYLDYKAQSGCIDYIRDAHF